MRRLQLKRVFEALPPGAPAVAAFLLLTVLTLWPSARDPGGAVAGWEGDNLFCIRQMWWMKHALLDLRISPFFDPNSYFPAGYDIAHGSFFPANTLLGLPLTALFGPVAGYNLMLMLSFFLTAAGAYLWVAHLTSSRAAGFVAGVIAGWLPYRFAHVTGHMHMMTTQWIVLSLYAFEKFREKPRLGRGLLLGLGGGLVVLSDWYYGYSAALLLPLYALIRTRPWRVFWRQAAVWRGFLAAGAVSLALVIPFVIPYARLMAGGGLSRSIEEMESWSMNVYAFLVPNLVHPAWRDALAPLFRQQASLWVEHGVTLGYIALSFAVGGWLYRRRSPAAGAWAAVWVASYLVALGPTLHALDRQVLLPLPEFAARGLAGVAGLFPSFAGVRDGLLARQAAPVPLPSFFLYLFVPLTRGMRVMSRFGVWTGLMTAALAGLGFKVFLEKIGRRRPRPGLALALLAAVAALVVFESWRSVPYLTVRPRKVDIWLSRQPSDTVIVELPVEQAMRPYQDYYQTVHQRRTVFGPVSDSFFPQERLERTRILTDFPSAAGIAALRVLGVRYVLFTPSRIPDWRRLQARVEASPGLRLRKIIRGVRVYELD
jgi:hypothetical protein